MSKPVERILKTNGISLNVIEQGQDHPKGLGSRTPLRGQAFVTA
jgi:hypothetical protein